MSPTRSPLSHLSGAGLKHRAYRVSWFKCPTRPIFFPSFDDSHCDRIHSSLTDDHGFDDDFVGKRPVIEWCDTPRSTLFKTYHGNSSQNYVFPGFHCYNARSLKGLAQVHSHGKEFNALQGFLPALMGVPPRWLSGERVGRMTCWL